MNEGRPCFCLRLAVAKHVLIKDFDLASVQKALRRPDAFSVGGLPLLL